MRLTSVSQDEVDNVVYVVTSGEDGLAAIRGIHPGNYTLLAWESIEPNAHLNKDYRAAYDDFGIPLRSERGPAPPACLPRRKFT